MKKFLFFPVLGLWCMLFFACQKEAVTDTELSSTEIKIPPLNAEASDRTTTTFTFSFINAIDEDPTPLKVELWYGPNQLLGTKTWINHYHGTVTFTGVPVDSYLDLKVKAKKAYPNPSANDVINLSYRYGALAPVSFSVTATAPPSTPWASIPWFNSGWAPWYLVIPF
jgi:hypothetical protein